MRTILGRLGLLFLCGAVAACGYGFRGKQNSLPQDVRSIAVPVFVNQTGEARIESIFTDEVIFQFTKSQMVRITNQGRADAVLYGTIVRADTEDVALTASETSAQQRVIVTMEASLVRRKDNKVLWEDKRLQQRRTYNVGTSVQTSESAKRAALTQVAGAMAQTIHDRVFENF